MESRSGGRGTNEKKDTAGKCKSQQNMIVGKNMRNGKKMIEISGRMLEEDPGRS